MPLYYLQEHRGVLHYAAQCQDESSHSELVRLLKNRGVNAEQIDKVINMI